MRDCSPRHIVHRRILPDPFPQPRTEQQIRDDLRAQLSAIIGKWDRVFMGDRITNGEMR